MEKMILPRAAELIIDRLQAHGYRADIVGGAVRDLYLGRPAPDYDITTNARPNEVKEIFSDVRTIDTGIKHGTVTVHIDGENYEVTTYRLDGEYKDARHPESVEFTDELALDLSRRDFTMNAMCYNHRDGITDLFGGKRDIDRKTVRTVGVAELRFSEDALRILRALRFAAVLDFEIEERTRASIFEKAHLLSKVSSERIYVEWKKLVSGGGAYRIISEYKEIFEGILGISLKCLPPEWAFLSAKGDARVLSLFAFGAQNPVKSFECAMQKLKTDNKTRNLGTSALEVLTKYGLNTVKDVLFALSEFGADAVALAIDVGCVTGKYSAEAYTLLEGAEKSGIPTKISELAIGGRELLAMGLVGEQVGQVLFELLNTVIDGRCENTKDALITMVASL